MRPPQILLTTPESLSLLLSHPDSFAAVRGAAARWWSTRSTPSPPASAATCSRLSLARLQAIAPGLRRVGALRHRRRSRGLSGLARAAWRCRDGRRWSQGDPGAEAEIAIMLPEDEKIPWSGHRGRWAAQNVMREIERHRTTLVFCNTRSLAELIFQDLWAVNDEQSADRHPPRLARRSRRGARSRRRWPTGGCAALVCTASLDLGVDWGDVDLRHPDGRAQGLVAAAAADRPRQPPARRAVRGDPRPRQPLRISRGARRARRDRARASSTPRSSAPARSTCSPSMSWPAPARRRSTRRRCSPRCAAPRLMPALDAKSCSAQVLGFIESGGYALRAYDKFKRLTREPDGIWRVSPSALHPAAPDERRHHRRRADATTSASGTAASSARSRTISPRR